MRLNSMVGAEVAGVAVEQGAQEEEEEDQQEEEEA
jgi:hypothetical protein